MFSQVKAPYLAVRPALFLWLGLALGLHAIPSTGDAKAIFNLANHRFWRNPLVIISYPFILLLYILNLLKRLHIDIVYVAVLFLAGKYLFEIENKKQEPVSCVFLKIMILCFVVGI